MNMTDPVSIAPLDASSFADFIAYLNDHLSDNGGAGVGHFQPMPQGLSFLAQEQEAAFRLVFDIALGAKGWRRVWVARWEDGRIIGHIDLRAHADNFAEHRCMLGIGVDRRHRKAGLGSALIAQARQWATAVAKLEWIDLQVIGENSAAISLYQRTGFIKTGEMPDMFRIDGKSFSYATMSLRLQR